MKPALEVENLSHEFTSGKVVLKNLNFSIRSKEKLVILGSNGSGKTTLLKILANLMIPTRGTVKLFGQPIDILSKTFRKDIAWVPASEHGFYNHLTGLENLLFFASLQAISKAQATNEITKWSLYLSLDEALRTPFFLCSSGMKQTLALARAFLIQPKVLILDEPTRSLDSTAATMFRETLKNLPTECSIIFSTHSKTEADVLGDHQIELKKADHAPSF